MCSRLKRSRARSSKPMAPWWCLAAAIPRRFCRDPWMRSLRPRGWLSLRTIALLFPIQEHALSRPPVLDETHLTAEQHVVFDDIRSGPRGLVEGPLRVWLQSPAFAERAQKLGAFCRYGTRIPARLSELAVVIVGSHWRSGFEWSVHAPIAAKAGIDAEVLEAIRLGERPSLIRADERAVYRFSQELLETKRISEDAYKEVVELVGVEGAIELVGILGYYTLISMTINAFEIPTADGKPEPFQVGESAERR